MDSKICIPQISPLLKWAGNKRNLLELIGKYYPENFSKYIEPFAGGAAVALDIAWNYSFEHEIIINDKNKSVYKFYRGLRNFDKFIKYVEDIKNKYDRLKDIEDKEKFYYRLREVFNLSNNKDMELYAARFFTLNRLCYRGLWRENKKNKMNTPFGHYRSFNLDRNNIRNVSFLVNNIYVYNQSFETMLIFCTPETFYYLDPPYQPISETSKFTSYNGQNWNESDLRRLKSFCDKITELAGKFLLSNSDTKEVRELFEDYNMISFRTLKKMDSKNKNVSTNELLIKNY